MLDPHTERMMMGAAGGAGDGEFIDKLFSTYLYKGTGSAKSVNNGIDLSGEGGMVWLKARNGTNDHVVNDTVRGAGNRLRTNVNAANVNSTAYLSAFNNNGFSVGTDSDVNGSGKDMASWTFRKSPGFFDIVTYTGNNTARRQIAHNIRSVPGCIVVKRLT